MLPLTFEQQAGDNDAPRTLSRNGDAEEFRGDPIVEPSPKAWIRD